MALILLTGATGYVGGRLLQELQAQSEPVRCLVRRPQNLRSRLSATTEIVEGDVLDPKSLENALAGVEIAYYLVHAMGLKRDFADFDRQGARNFAAAARRQGVRRVIYLGGLGDAEAALSPHLKSRQEVGEILRQSGILTVELRASIIIGSGSLSFEMIRSLVEKLPVMVTPRWVTTPSQPIFIGDVVNVLLQSAKLPLTKSEIFEIGGDEVVSYGDLMRAYAEVRGLKRWMIPVPILSPWLSSLWLGLVTPVTAGIGRKLVDSIRNPTVVRQPAMQSIFNINPLGVQESIARALRNEDKDWTETRWSDALSSAGPLKTWAGVTLGNRILDSRVVHVPAPPEKAFLPIQSIGGKNGWYFGNILWRLRGLLDRLVGGVGLRRGRRDAVLLRVGDSIDFWRVECFEADRLLRLSAEMKLPGRAWLEFEVEKTTDGSNIRQTAIFDPRGLWGLLYWYLLYPLHALVFAGLLNGIVKQIPCD